MKATLHEADDDHVRLELDAGQTLITTLGAACSLKNLSNGTYFTPDGPSADVYLFNPTIKAGPQTVLTFLISRRNACSPQSAIEIRLPTSKFRGEFNWPDTLQPSTANTPRLNSDLQLLRHKPRALRLLPVVMMLAGAVLLGFLVLTYHQRSLLKADQDAILSDRARVQAIFDKLTAGQAEMDTAKAKLAADLAKLSSAQNELALLRSRLEMERSTFESEKKKLADDRDMLSRSAQPAVSVSAPTAMQSPSNTPDQEAAMIRECDRLAANPGDSRKPADIPGVSYRQIDVAAAITACQQAVASAPREPRMAYQLGRALQQSDTNQARRQHQIAANMGYGAAYDNLGRIAMDYDKDTRAAGQYFRRGVELDDLDSMVSLAGHIIDNSLGEEYADERYELLFRARDRGSKAAEDMLRKHPPPVLRGAPDQGLPGRFRSLFMYRQ